ncbi:hypothetical protein CTAYLR_008597 [Chrysophaeum taylorii]|uniref:Uncharacterized protein n=1 Tax=Chrysophaeum taylorii TaxID=2483200 RepID=A0AAD7UJL2_9STRA|nr:hypothetical protein CTAYLR_008597 [Chrysophaeum taylorii]
MSKARGPARQLAKDPVVHEAFDMLKIETELGPRLHVRDLGELLYLVTQITFTKSRVAALLKVVDPVYEVTHLDEAQCQYLVERVRNVLRAEDLQQATPHTLGLRSNQSNSNFHMAGELETPDFECCSCAFGTTSSKKTTKQDCCSC